MTEAAAPDALEAITAFLDSIGLPLQERRLKGPTFLPGIAIERGTLVYDRERLTWPGDLLHEAGHIAVTPPALRPRLSDNIEPELLATHGEEPEATAWAFAAITAIGLHPSILFHSGGYHGKSERLVFTYLSGVYPGVAGLVAAGLTLTPAEATAQGVQPYPAMRRWLRE